MVEKSSADHEKGLSARHLVLMFLTGVAVCAVFFALGFLVGYNERPSRGAPAAERVTDALSTPPAGNPPTVTIQPSSGASAPATSAAVPGEEVHRQALPGPAAGATGASPSTGGSVKAPGGTPDANEESGPAASSLPLEVRPGFTVQVTASHTKQDVETLMEILKSRGYPVLLVSPEYAHTNDNLYRLQVGPFATREDAEKARAKLAKEGFFKDLFIKHSGVD